MSDNYIIEIHPTSVGITVQAGIVVRDGRRFRFYAATDAFGSLEGRLFKSLKAAESAALRHNVDTATCNRFGELDLPHQSEWDRGLS